MPKLYVYLLISAIALCHPAYAAETADEVLSNHIAHSQLAPLPAEWFSCHNSSDCKWVGYDCAGNGYAVNLKHTDDARGVFCLTNHLCGAACLVSLAPNSKAVCETDRCVTEPLIVRNP